jgi:hypothetical protein
VIPLEIEEFVQEAGFFARVGDLPRVSSRL